MNNVDSVRSLDDARHSDIAVTTTYTVHGLRRGGDVWLFGVQAGAHPLVDANADGDERIVWLSGVPYERTSTVVDATDLPTAIQTARRQVLFAADLLCERCEDGEAERAAPRPYRDQRWCRPCVDDHWLAD